VLALKGLAPAVTAVTGPAAHAAVGAIPTRATPATIAAPSATRRLNELIMVIPLGLLPLMKLPQV
jgi:hypothetical protein